MAASTNLFGLRFMADHCGLSGRRSPLFPDGSPGNLAGRAAAALLYAPPVTSSGGFTRTDDVPAAFDERTVLTTMLDYVRDTVHVKCTGVTEEDAHRAPLPGSPLTTIAGLVSHLRWVEYYWFDVVLLAKSDTAPWTDEDPDREMRIAAGIPLEQLLAEYRASCAGYRELVAGLELDAGSRGPLSWRAEPLTLRWILNHLIEETARHNGHLDILREMADGVTGS
jgi:uncharacterized damage-inducible protein DinB